MSKKNQNKEVAVVKNNFEVSADLTAEFKGLGLGAGEEIDGMDIIIPKLILTQGLTKAVTKGKIGVGTYLHSTEETDMGNSLDMIVIGSYKVWQIFEVVENGKDIYLETIEYYGNENLAYNEVVAGKPINRKQVLGFHVLLIDEILKGEAFPYVVDFKGGSKAAGRKLSTAFAKLRSKNLPSFAKVFTLGTELIEDEFTYHAKTVSMGRDITLDELNAVKMWLAELASNKDKYKADDSEERNENDNNTVEANFVDSSDVPF